VPPKDHTPESFMNPGSDWGQVLMNPMFRFAIRDCTSEDNCQPLGSISRNTRFEWSTSGGFNTLAVQLSPQDPSILPESMSVNPANGQIAVTDGSFQGLILVSTGTLSATRTYF